MRGLFSYTIGFSGCARVLAIKVGSELCTLKFMRGLFSYTIGFSGCARVLAIKVGSELCTF